MDIKLLREVVKVGKIEWQRHSLIFNKQPATRNKKPTTFY